MNKSIYICLIFLLSLSSAKAQEARSRKNLFSLGMFFDRIFLKEDFDLAEEDFYNNLGYRAGFFRGIGANAMVGVEYVYFVGPTNGGINPYYGSTDLEVKVVGMPSNVSRVSADSYIETGLGFSLQSRYYFDEHADLYGSGAYVGLIYERHTIIETLNGVNFSVPSSSGFGTTTTSYAIGDLENRYKMNRVGLRYGVTLTGDVFFIDSYISGVVNLAPDKGKLFTGVTRLAPISIAIGINFGFGL